VIPYVIRQGDYLKKLAFTKGFDADEVWGAPENADLKAARPDPDILCPGDILYVPELKPDPLPLNVGGESTYTGDVPTVSVRIILVEGGSPLANELFAVDGLPEPMSGTTTTDGCVMFEAPITLREVSIVLPNRNLSYPVRIGDLDPKDEPSGVASRLAHLGCYGWFPEEEGDFDPEQHRMAIATFQAMIGGDSTGECDDATLDALHGKHGV
jgi:hypothetical protein